MLVLLAAAVASAADPRTTTGGCYPMRELLWTQLSREGLCTDRVFVEDWSTCEGRNAGGRLAIDASRFETLEALLVGVVAAYNEGPGLDYTARREAIGWVVQPMGVPTLFDTVVTLDPARFPTVTAQMEDLKVQLKASRGISIGLQGTADRRNTTPTGVAAGRMRFVDAVAAMHLALEAPPWASPPPHFPLARIGLSVAVSEAQHAGSTRLVMCEVLVEPQREMVSGEPGVPWRPDPP